MLLASHTDPDRAGGARNATVYISTPRCQVEKLGSGSPVRAKLTEQERRDLSPTRTPAVDGKRTRSGRLGDITRLYQSTWLQLGPLRMQGGDVDKPGLNDDHLAPSASNCNICLATTPS